MAPSRRTHLHLFLGLVISAAAVYLSLKKIDFHALGAALRSADYLYLLPAMIAQAACFFLKGMGWRYLLLPAKKTISPLSTTAVLIIGLMVNDLFPAKMGELARAYLIGEKEKLPKSLCLSTILVEHLLDILVLLVFLLILLPMVSLPPWLQTSGIIVGFGALIFIIALFFLMRREEIFLKWIHRLAGFLPGRVRDKIRSLARNVIQGLRVVTGRYLFYSLAFLGGMWSLVSLIAYLAMAAFGLFLPVQAAVMVTVFTAFGKIIPSSPGAIGTFHYLVILVLGSFGVGKETALAYAIVLHALSFLMEISLGVLLLLASNLSLARIARQAEETT
jgi:glycosyltransferase 2 family protein